MLFNINNTEIKEGQVWLVSMPIENDDNEDHIQKKSRPCLVVSNDTNNRFNGVINIVPITSSRDRIRGKYQYQYYVDEKSGIQTVLCEQVNTVNKKKFIKYLYTLSDNMNNEVKNCLKIQFNIK